LIGRRGSSGNGGDGGGGGGDEKAHKKCTCVWRDHKGKYGAGVDPNQYKTTTQGLLSPPPNSTFRVFPFVFVSLLAESSQLHNKMKKLGQRRRNLKSTSFLL